MFADVLPVILKHEGGLVNHPNDRGKLTNFGITQAIYDDYRKRSVASIEPAEVQDIYENRYWLPSGCSELQSVSTRVALAQFDASVNHGPQTATVLLQRALKGVQVDGVFGPATMKALKITIRDDTEAAVIDRMLGYRLKFYEDIITRRPDQKVFAKGWKNRISDLSIAMWGAP